MSKTAFRFLKMPRLKKKANKTLRSDLKVAPLIFLYAGKRAAGYGKGTAETIWQNV